MLQLYDKNHVKIEGLTKYKDYNIESVLSSGDKTLSFSYPALYCANIQEEGYIRTKSAEFVIKQIEGKADWKTIKATLNLEDLEGKPWDRFDSTEQTITACLNLALAGTGWSVGTCNVTKKRTVRKTGCSAWDIVQEAVKTYRVEVEFDTLNKVINIFDKMGSDKGAYFIDSLNLKELTVQSNSYSYYTRIQAVGKDGLTLPAPGYVENYQYSNKIKTLYWKDERYTDVTSLTEDSTLKLDEISKPYRAYGADILDLASNNDKYKDILSYSLGDTITLISKDLKVKEKQRIAKITEYPDESERNTCELANVILSFEDVQKENQDTTDTVDNITEDDGTVSQGAISQAVNNLTAQQFSAVTGRIGTLETTTAHVTNGVIDNATIGVEHVNDLYANYAHITNGKLDNVIIGTEQVENSAITNAKIANEAVGTSQIQLGAITQALIANEAVGSSQIANLSVGDAKIIDLSLSKLKAGDISTTKFRIVSDSGKLLMSDNTIQISDASRVRVQIGKDASNDYNMYVWDASGNLMFDATGLKASGIKAKIIRDDMVSDTANINAAKINIDSMFTQMNANEASTLKGSKIYLDTQAQTLQVAFTSLSSTVSSQGTTITSQGTSIGVIQGQISSKIWNTDITTAVNNIQIGGRNLILNSNFYNGFSGWNSNYATGIVKETDDLPIGASSAIKFVCSANNYGIYYSGFTAINGQTYTLSFYAKASSSINFNCGYGVTDGRANFAVTTTWQKFTKTFTGDGVNHAMVFYPQGAISYGYITNVKLEVGTKATDWTPAPEDIQTQIDTHTTEISQNTTDISLKASQSSLDTTNSNVSSLTSRMSTAEASITTNANNIALKVSTSTYDAGMATKEGTITKSSTAPSSPTTNMLWLDTSVTPNILKRYTGSAWVKATPTTAAEVAAYSSASGSALEGRMSTAESSISVNSSNIALKVSKDSIISSINQTAESVKIQASKIDLSGYVTVSALGTEGATTINGANITTGTISADRISGGSLTIGSTGNANGIITILNDNPVVGILGTIDNTGLHFTDRPLEVSESGGTGVVSRVGRNFIGVGTWNGDTALTGCQMLSNGSIYAGTVYLNNWFRSTGNTGWYSESYGGGWHMTDTTWIRALNGKSVYTPGKVQADSGYNKLGLAPAFTWSGSIASGSSVTLTHYLGYYPIIQTAGSSGNLILTFDYPGSNQVKVTNYNGGGNTWSGVVYLW